MTGKRERRQFFSTCISWPEALSDAKDFLDENGEEVSRQTFLQHVDLRDFRSWEKALGYTKTLKMRDDWHVRYFLEPQTQIAFFVHSAIEHVFATREEIEDLQRRISDPGLPEPLLVIEKPGHLAATEPLDPGYSDRLDEVLDTLMGLGGPVLVIEDESSTTLGTHDRLNLERSLQLRQGFCEIHRVFAGGQKPDGIPGREIDAGQIDALIKTLSGPRPVVIARAEVQADPDLAP